MMIMPVRKNSGRSTRKANGVTTSTSPGPDEPLMSTNAASPVNREQLSARPMDPRRMPQRNALLAPALRRRGLGDNALPGQRHALLVAHVAQEGHKRERQAEHQSGRKANRQNFQSVVHTFSPSTDPACSRWSSVFSFMLM